MAQNGGGKGWAADETGEKTMPSHWQSFLDWLLQGAERTPKTQRDWAIENDIHEDSLRRIKRDHRFIKEWDRRAAELNSILISLRRNGVLLLMMSVMPLV